MGGYRGGGDLEGRIGSGGGGGNSPEVGIGLMGGPGNGRYGDVGVRGGPGSGGDPGWVGIEVVGTYREGLGVDQRQSRYRAHME